MRNKLYYGTKIMAGPIGNTQGNIFLSALGSFWVKFFKDKGTLENILHGNQISLSDFYFRFCEIVLSKSLKDTPVFSQKKWQQLVFKESETNKDVDNLFKYGDEDLKYGDDGLVYGGSFPDSSQIAFKLPNDINDLGGFICNKIYNPSLVLSRELNFTVKNQVIIFKEDIFSNELVPIRNILDNDGQVIDREVSLWAPKAFFDKKDLFRNYGEVFGVERESSEEYKNFLLTLLNLYMSGPKNQIVEGFVNAAFNLPIIIEEKEIVKFIIEEQDQTRVITDKNEYILPLKDHVRSLVPGEELAAFTPLYDIIDVFDFKSNSSWFRERQFFTIPEFLLGPQYSSEAFVRRKFADVNFQLGATFPVEILGDIDEDFKRTLENFPITLGQSGLNVGDETSRISTFDFVLDQIKKNLLIILFKSTSVPISEGMKVLKENLDLNLPAICAYLIVLEISENLEDTINTEDIDDSEISLGLGVTPEDTLDIDVDTQDGFFGLPIIGPNITVGSFTLGVQGFIGKPNVTIIRKGACG